MRRVDDKCVPESLDDVLDIMVSGPMTSACADEIAGIYDSWEGWGHEELRDLALVFAIRELADARRKLVAA